MKHEYHLSNYLAKITNYMQHYNRKNNYKNKWTLEHVSLSASVLEKKIKKLETKWKLYFCKWTKTSTTPTLLNISCVCVYI